MSIQKIQEKMENERKEEKVCKYVITENETKNEFIILHNFLLYKVS